MCRSSSLAMALCQRALKRVLSGGCGRWPPSLRMTQSRQTFVRETTCLSPWLCYFFKGALVLIVLSALLPAIATAVTPAQLGALNFNLYPRPCAANELFLKDIKGNPLNLQSLRGNVVILNFWRIDCPPCAMEKPILERIHQKYASRGLAIVAVNLFDGIPRVKDYLGRCRFSFICASDPDNRFSVKSQMLASGRPTAVVVNPDSEAIYEIAAVPTTYLINREGQIVGQSFGVVNWEQGPLTELLESLLGEPARTIAGLPSASPATAAQPPLSAALQTSQRVSSPPPDNKTTTPPAAVSSPAQAPPRLPFAAMPVSSVPVADRGSASAPALASGPKQESSVRLAQSDTSGTPPQVGVRRNPAASEQAPKTRQVTSQVPSPSVKPAVRSPQQPPPRPPAASALGAAPAATRTNAPPAAAPIAGPLPSMLPKAHPYSPNGAALPVYSTPRAAAAGRSGSKQPDVPLTLDANGYVTARVPTTPEDVSTRPASRPAPITVRPLPSAAPVGEPDTLSGFVTNSFQSTKPSPQPAAARPQAAPTPQSSVPSFFGELGKFATGIRDAVSKTLPSR